MKKKFTTALWKKCLGNIYDKVPVRKFFLYIDLIQIFIGDNTIFLFAPNSHIKIIVERYYYGQIIINIRKFVGSLYKIEFRVGAIYINEHRKIVIKKTSFKSLKLNNLADNCKVITELCGYKNFFVYVHVDNYLTYFQKNKIIIDLKRCGFSGIQTNLYFLLKNKKDIKYIISKYDMLVLMEKKYDCDFYLLLNKNIEKIKMILENKNILFISNVELNILKENFLNIK
ncbi:MAG TPA: hypothetical protein V7792_00210 [Candidatus Azoamicus sp. OHIO2]